MSEQRPDRSADEAVHALLAKAKALATTNPSAALAMLEREPHPRHGLYHHARGALAVQVCRFDDAVASLEEAVRLLPDVADVRANLGAALLARARPLSSSGQLGIADVARAVTELESAFRSRPHTADAGASFVLALELAGRPDDAIAIADENLRRFPDDATTLFNRASALHAAGRLVEARTTLETLVARHQEHPVGDAARAALARLSMTTTGAARTPRR
jgi:tetratricopeptide (TPR) repeat protein